MERRRGERGAKGGEEKNSSFSYRVDSGGFSKVEQKIGIKNSSFFFRIGWA